MARSKVHIPVIDWSTNDYIDIKLLTSLFELKGFHNLKERRYCLQSIRKKVRMVSARLGILCCIHNFGGGCDRGSEFGFCDPGPNFERG